MRVQVGLERGGLVGSLNRGSSDALDPICYMYSQVNAPPQTLAEDKRLNQSYSGHGDTRYSHTEIIQKQND